MRSSASSVCLTRVIVDGQPGIELAALQDIVERIQSAVQYVVPRSHQHYIGAALLQLAVARLLGEAGAQHTAMTLIRLVDSVLETDAPDAASPREGAVR